MRLSFQVVWEGTNDLQDARGGVQGISSTLDIKASIRYGNPRRSPSTRPLLLDARPWLSLLDVCPVVGFGLPFTASANHDHRDWSIVGKRPRAISLDRRRKHKDQWSYEVKPHYPSVSPGRQQVGWLDCHRPCTGLRAGYHRGDPPGNTFEAPQQTDPPARHGTELLALRVRTRTHVGRCCT